jgi:hypothetical protein
MARPRLRAVNRRTDRQRQCPHWCSAGVPSRRSEPATGMPPIHTGIDEFAEFS